MRNQIRDAELAEEALEAAEYVTRVLCLAVAADVVAAAVVVAAAAVASQDLNDRRPW